MTNTSKNIALSGKARKAIGNYDWDQARIWYEQTELTITALARKIGCTRQAVNQHAQQGNWHRQFVADRTKTDNNEENQEDNKDSKDRYWYGRSKKRETDQATFVRKAIEYLVDNNKDHVLLERFCQQNEVFKDDIQMWAEKSKLIASLLSRALEAEKAKLLQLGLTRKIDPQPAKIWLDYKHGVREKREDKTSSVVIIEIGGALNQLTY